MGRTPCSLKQGLTRGAWTAKEDMILTEYVEAHGETGWRTLPKKAGLNRCGKSCRLRWLNYLRPNIKRGNISPDEEDLILRLHRLLGNRWALIAGRLPGRTDNEIKNYWNTHLSKKLAMSSVDPKIHKPIQKAVRTPYSSKANFPVQKHNSPPESFSGKSNIDVMRLTPVKRSQDYTVAPFNNSVPSETVGTGNSAGMPLCVGNHDQIDLSKSWSQLLEDTCTPSDYDNSELIDIQLSNEILVSESCLEAETDHSQSVKVPSVCTFSSPVGTEFEQPVHPLGCSNSVQSISRLNDSYSDPDCVPLTVANSVDSRSIEEFCMESLLIETPDCDLEEIYQPPERNDCNDKFDHNMDCFAMGAAAEQGRNEIYNNTLQLDWTHELLEQFLHKHSTVDLDDSLDHLLGSENEDFWSEGLMINPQHSKDNYVDIVMDLLLEE